MATSAARVGDTKRALVDGHFQALSPVVFAGSDRVVDHFNTLMKDAARMLRTSATLQLLKVPLKHIKELSENGNEVYVTDLLSLLVHTVETTPLESIVPLPDMRRPWSAPTGSGKPPTAPIKSQINDSIQRDPTPPGINQRPGSGGGTSRPGSGKKVSFDHKSPVKPLTVAVGDAASAPAPTLHKQIVSGSKSSGGDKRLQSNLDRALGMLQELRVMSSDDDTVDLVDQAIECLSDTHALFEPQTMALDQHHNKTEEKVPLTPASAEDPETKEWLRANFADTPRFYGRGTFRSLKNVVRSVLASLWLVKISGNKTSDADALIMPGLDLTPVTRAKLIDSLAPLHEWDFDVFSIATLTGVPIQATAYALMRSSVLPGQLPIDEPRFMRFVKEIELLYHDNPYHTATHGADVMQTMMYFLGKGELATHMTPLEVLACMVAALAHDVDHDGKNNNFHIQSISKVALTHNNKAVLENHSTKIVFELLKRDECNFAKKFDRQQFLQFRDHVIELILATDMSQHFAVMGQVKSKITSSGDQPIKREDIPLYSRLAIKCADVSNPAKQREVYLRWVDRVMEEFFQQGDREKELGYNVSPFMDRATTSISKCQIGFIEFIVLPLYQTCSYFIEEMGTPIAHIETNLKYFKKINEKEQAQQQANQIQPAQNK